MSLAQLGSSLCVQGPVVIHNWLHALSLDYIRFCCYNVGRYVIHYGLAVY